MSEQNSTQEVNEWENRWIVLSQICMAWQGTAILARYGQLREREAGSKETQRLNFNQRHNAIPLRSVQPGTPVHIKDMGTTGTIAGAAETPRSYLVETENGTVRRNRSHVNPIPTNKPASPSVLDKPVSPSVVKKQARDLTPLKQLPSPCLSSDQRDSLDPLSSYKRALDFAEHWTLVKRHFETGAWTLFLFNFMNSYHVW